MVVREGFGEVKVQPNKVAERFWKVVGKAADRRGALAVGDSTLWTEVGSGCDGRFFALPRLCGAVQEEADLG